MSLPSALDDAALPGLALALDSDAFLDLLSQNLPECRAGVTLSEARAIDVQYEPGQSATVLVRVKLREAGAHHTTKQLLCVRALRRDEPMPSCPDSLLARYAARRADREGRRESPLTTPWLVLPDHAMAIHAFPLDPGLPTLLDVTDPQVLRAALSRLWSPRKTRARSVKVDTLAYTPGSRAALSFEVLSEDRGTQLPHLRHMVGKIHARRSPARLFAGAWTVWSRAKGRIDIAPPAGYIESLGLSLQEFVQGRRLSDLAGTPAFIKPVRQSARSIAHLHSLHLPLHSERTVSKEAAVVQRWLDVLMGIMPARRENLARLGEKLLSELHARFTPKGAVHADFHLANVLVHRGSVIVVDWDQVAHGDPMLDVGRFLASLRVSALRTKQDPAGLSDVADAFLTTYLQATGDDETRARLFEAGALLIAAGAPFRLQREGWLEQAEVIVDEAWRCLDLSLRGARVTTASRPALLPLAERIAWASDPTFALAIVGPLVRSAHEPSLDIVSCVPEVVSAGSESCEMRFGLKGHVNGSSWTGSATLNCHAEPRGRGVLRRLASVREVTAALPDVLRLPVPLGQAPTLEGDVFEPPAGQAISRALIRGQPAAVAQDLGRGLAALHAIAIELDKERSLDRELDTTGRRVASLTRGDVRARAERLLAELLPMLTGAPTSRATVLRDLRLRDLTWSAELGVGVVIVRDVTMGSPLAMAGALAARLGAWEVAHARPGVRDAFVRSYLALAGVKVRDWAPFESLGLLRAACRAARPGEVVEAVRLLDDAERALRTGT